MSAINYIFITLQALAIVSLSYQICSVIDPPEHGDIKFHESFSYYQVSCDPGYIMIGKPTGFCYNDEWDNSLPKCVANEGGVCEKLSAPENGKITCDEAPLTFGKSCRFECNEGYKLQGVEIRRCWLNFQWSGPSVKCIPMSSTFCSLPPLLKHGTVVGCSPSNMPRPSQTCGFRCNGGYVLRGPVSVTCSSAGKLVDDNGLENFPECVAENTGQRKYPSNPCFEKNGGCEHYCSLTREREVFCSCRPDYKVGSDPKSCIKISSPERVNDDLLSEKKNLYSQQQVKNEDGSISSGVDVCYNHQCEQICRNEDGRAQCRCEKGYTLHANQRNCIKSPCDPLPIPENGEMKCRPLPPTVGTICDFSCFPGYTRQGSGRRRCVAKYKWSGTEFKCIRLASTPAISNPVTCQNNNGGCQHKCDIKWTTVECSCRKGYVLHTDGKQCVDVDECSNENLNSCQHYCRNTEGSYTCSCKPGYILLDGYRCEDIDECSNENLNSCQHYCRNTEGSYTCTCKPGYILLDGYKCDGCGKNAYLSSKLRGCVDCPKNSHTDSEGKTSVRDCVCNSGYIGDPGEGIECEDVDECLSDNFGCSDACNNIPGSAYCHCPAGFMLDRDNKTCIDIDECSIKNGGCEGRCENRKGSFRCICPEGYKRSNRDHYSCDDVNECLDNNGGCEQTCINYKGGYYCACENGYRLDSGLKNCSGIQCPALPVPLHSHVVCRRNGEKFTEMEDYPVGTVCKFKCNSGFKITKGSSNLECQEDGMWNGNVPECESQRCPLLKAPENGAVHPKSCSTQGTKVKQKCTFSCKQGYRLKGPTVFVCRNDLTWNIDKDPVCEPVKIQPRIECPRDITETLLSRQNAHNITVPEPTTNMETYEVQPYWVTVGTPVEFSAGVTEVIFTATSTNSNTTAECVVIITVLDKEPPVFEFCPDPIRIEGANVLGELVTWEEPVVTDNVEVESVFSLLEPNTTLTPGTHVVEYIARDLSGNIASCSFDISIARMNCIDLVDPKNGEANCMDWMFGKLCQPSCNAGYMRNLDDPLYYSCDDTGIWEPSDKISECLPICNTSCENGGECAEENHCICTPGYRGDRCQYALDLCEPEKGLQVSADWSCNHSPERTVCVMNCPQGTSYESPPADNYHCSLDGAWTPSFAPKCIPLNVIEPPAANGMYIAATQYINATSSSCPDGFELKTMEENGEEICVECPSNTIWSAATRKCE